MALLGQPSGHLLSDSTANTSNTVICYTRIFGTMVVDSTITVSIKFIGWVSNGIKTTVYIKINGSANPGVYSEQKKVNLETNISISYLYLDGYVRVSTLKRSGEYISYDILSTDTYYGAKLNMIIVSGYAKYEWFGPIIPINVTAVMTTGNINFTQTSIAKYCTDQAVIINSVNSFEGDDSKHICLPTNVYTGYFIRIKNVTKNKLFVHALNKIIEDGVNGRIISKISTTDFIDYNDNITISASECGFIMPKNASCMLLYDGSRWLIDEYYSGQRSPFFNIIEGVTPVNTTMINNAVVIANINSANKFVQLPDPSGLLRHIIIISYGSSLYQLYFTVGSSSSAKIDGISYSQYNWWGIRPVSTNQNAAVTLLSNGIDWYVMSCTDGVSINFDNNINDYTPVKNTHTTLISNTDGLSLIPTIIPSSGSAIFYLKHGIVSPFNNSLIITTTDGAFIGGNTNVHRTWLDGKLNRSAGSVLGTNVNGTPMFFLLSYFMGL
jgi:hypothetical protein